MFCKNCGNSINNNTQFCPYCGSKIIQEISNSPVQGVPVYVTPYIQGKRKISTGSIIIISVAAFLLIVLPLFGIIISALSQGISKTPMEGTWDCKTFSTSSSGDYVTTITFEKNNKFTWAKYNDTLNNYIKGDYTYSYVEKSNVQNNNKYYKVVFNGNDVVLNGQKSDETFNPEYEMGITTTDSGETQSVLINVKTYGMYYCYKR